MLGVFVHYTDEQVQRAAGRQLQQLMVLFRVGYGAVCCEQAAAEPQPQHNHTLPPPQVDATVRSWNVKILGINRQSRHRDATVAQEFWRMLDAHLAARSSSLAY